MPTQKLSGNVKSNVDLIIDDGEYVCGGNFTDDERAIYAIPLLCAAN